MAAEPGKGLRGRAVAGNRELSLDPAVFRKRTLALTSPGTLYLWRTMPVWQSITQTASPPHVATVCDVAPECPVLWYQPHKQLFCKVLPYSLSSRPP